MQLDGREFEAIDQQITAAQNDYVTAYLRLAGAMDLLLGLDPKSTDADVNKLREKFLTQIRIAGLKSKVLAGCLTEKGKRWSRDEADRNAAIFDQITEPSEQATMTQGLVGVVLGFFPYAGRSSETSPKSSSPSDEVQSTENGAPAISATSPGFARAKPLTPPSRAARRLIFPTTAAYFWIATRASIASGFAPPSSRTLRRTG